MSGHCRPVALLLLLTCAARPADGQGLGFGAAAVLDAPEAGLWTLGYSPRGFGPFDLTLNGLYYSGAGRGRWGGGVDLSMFRRAGVRWHLMGGVQAGFGTGEAEVTWTAWSAGVGFRLFRAGKVDLALEGRYLHLSAPDDALLLGLRLGIGLGGRRAGSAPGSSGPAAGAVPLATVVPAARSAAAQAVIETALAAMGTPYAWGGTDANGFDCSGLIQYAYRAHGVPLPRRSTDQAREGAAVPRNLSALQPGDILTFGSGNEGVSHLGLYLGEGRFIHSATGGVQVSTLGPDDPAGSYWWRRWVGARRVLPDAPDF